jgi:hypothetical protein
VSRPAGAHLEAAWKTIDACAALYVPVHPVAARLETRSVSDSPKRIERSGDITEAGSGKTKSRAVCIEQHRCGDGRWDTKSIHSACFSNNLIH